MSQENDANIYVVEQVQMSSDSQASQLLDDIDDLQDFQDSLNDINELDQLMKSMAKPKQNASQQQLTILQNEHQQIKYKAKHVKRLQVVDDYIRNFLTKNRMQKTLASFQKEWYDYVENSKNNKEDIYDAYLERQVLKEKIQLLQAQHSNALILSEKAKKTYDKLLKERDFHKMHHQRVQRDKKKLNQNIERLNVLQIEYNKKYEQLIEKYNYAVKEKSLIKIERDKIKAELQPHKKQGNLPSIELKKNSTIKSNKIKYTVLPSQQQMRNPYGTNIESFSYRQAVMSKTNKGHTMGVGCVVFHPKKGIVATGGDDMIWKIWMIEQSEFILSGQGHKDWISAIKFHPSALHVITASGDATIKVWDLAQKSCTYTFNKDHVQPICSIDLNSTGDYIATGAMDHSSRLLDINIGKCRNVMRGHVDTVNSVHFKPYSNMLTTASADKTVSIWDVRTNLCVQTFYGHNNSVNACKVTPQGNRIISCDSNGIVKSWDLRTGSQANHYSVNKCCYCISIDRSGSIFAVGCEGGQIYLYNDITAQKEHTLQGHEEKSRVNAIQFDMNSKMIVSGGSDCTYRIWQ